MADPKNADHGRSDTSGSSRDGYLEWILNFPLSSHASPILPNAHFSIPITLLHVCRLV